MHLACQCQSPMSRNISSYTWRLTCKKLARAASPQVSNNHWNRYTGPEVSSCALWKSWVCSVMGILLVSADGTTSAAVPGSLARLYSRLCMPALPSTVLRCNLHRHMLLLCQQCCRSGSSHPRGQMVRCVRDPVVSSRRPVALWPASTACKSNGGECSNLKFVSTESADECV